ELAVIVKEKTRGEFRFSKPSGGFAVARGGGIQQRKSLEDRRGCHVGVQNRDELFSDVDVGLSDARVLAERNLPLRFACGALQQVEQTADSEQRQRKTGGQQRIDHTGCRRQERPHPSTDLNTSERQARRVHEWEERTRSCELVLH